MIFFVGRVICAGARTRAARISRGLEKETTLDRCARSFARVSRFGARERTKDRRIDLCCQLYPYRLASRKEGGGGAGEGERKDSYVRATYSGVALVNATLTSSLDSTRNVCG